MKPFAWYMLGMFSGVVLMTCVFYFETKYILGN